MVRLRITECCEPDALARLEPIWRALQARCPQATPWQTWEWNDAWWRHFGGRKRLRLLLFHDTGAGEDPVGLAPLYTGRYLYTPLRRLAWLGTGHSDYLGPLALPEHEAEVTGALLSYLRNSARGWDVADLQQIRPTSTLCGQVSGSGRYETSNGGPVLLPMDVCPYLSLPARWEDLTARLGKKMRSNIGYHERLLHKTFPEAEYALADEVSLEADMTALFDLHQRRWRARHLPGALGGRRVQTFHRDVAARFLNRGWLRLHLLRLSEGPCAAIYCFAYGGRTYYYLGGYALHLGRYSLGTLLTARAIRNAIEEGHDEFDFLRGREPYKYRWLPEERTNQRLLAPCARGHVSGLSGRAGMALNRAERRVIAQAKAIFANHHSGADETSATTKEAPVVSKQIASDPESVGAAQPVGHRHDCSAP